MITIKPVLGRLNLRERHILKMQISSALGNGEDVILDIDGFHTNEISSYLISDIMGLLIGKHIVLQTTSSNKLSNLYKLLVSKGFYAEHPYISEKEYFMKIGG